MNSNFESLFNEENINVERKSNIQQILSFSTKRKEYMKEKLNQRQKQYDEEMTKKYGKGRIYESQSFKEMKQQEREGKRIQLKERKIYERSEEKQRKEDDEKKFYQQQYEEMMKQREEQQRLSDEEVKALLKTKTSQEQITEARRKYLERKQLKKKQSLV